MENSTHPVVTSSPGSSENGASSSRKRPFDVLQKIGTETCKHCSFRSSKRHSVELHEQQHFACYSSPCLFCTYSSKNFRSLMIHINRVHPEKKNMITLKNLSTNFLKKVDTLTKTNEDKESVKKSTDGDQPEDLSLPKDADYNGILPLTTKNVEVVDITMESDDERTEEFIGIDKHNSDGFPYNQRQPINTKLVYQLVYNASVKNVSPRQSARSCYSTSPPDLSKDDGRLDFHKQDLLTMVELPPLTEPITHPISQEEEELCRSELSNLKQEIESAKTMILKAANSIKDEARATQMARFRAASNLRKNMEELEKEDRRQFAQLILLMEQSERYQKELKDLIAQKIQLEQEIDHFKEVSVDKRINLNPIASNSSTDGGVVADQQKKCLLTGVKEKLAATQKNDSNMSARIRGVEQEKRENKSYLAKVRADLESLEGNCAARISSTEAVQLQALIEEQHRRIVNFASLEKKRAWMTYNHDLVEIQRKKEELLNELKKYGEEYF